MLKYLVTTVVFLIISGCASQHIKVDTSGSFPLREATRAAEIIDYHKENIFSIYVEALNDDPKLEGKISFSFVVDPSGSVIEYLIIHSDFTDKNMERGILDYIKRIDFGAEAVRSTQYRHTFHFLPY